MFLYLFLIFSSIGFLNPSLYLYAEAMKAQENKQQPSSSSSFPHSSSSLHSSSSSHSSTPSDYDTPIESFYRDVANGDNKCLKDPYEYCCLQGFTAMEGWDPVSGIMSYRLILMLHNILLLYHCIMLLHLNFLIFLSSHILSFSNSVITVF